MIFYTNKFVDEGKAGKAIACFIFIRPEYKSDIGLLIHEQTHVKQFWRNPFKMLFTIPEKQTILQREIEAYTEQINYYVEQKMGDIDCYINYFALMIFDKYNLNIKLSIIQKWLNISVYERIRK
jgi:hypothetical protein